MQPSEKPPLDELAVEDARIRAARFPQGRMPCPGCAASVKGINFPEHATTKHRLTLGQVVRSGDAGQRGVDRRIRRTFVAAVVVWLVCLAALAAPAYEGIAGSPGTEPGNLSSAAAGDLFSRMAQQPFWWLLLAGVLACAVSVIAYSRGTFRARVTVHRDQVVLRHRLGTGRVSVRLPAEVHSGEIYRLRSRSFDDPHAVKTREGVYLRVARGIRGITVGCKNNTGLRKHWTGWSSAGPRKGWDLTLEAHDFVAFQYALARHHVIEARFDKADQPGSEPPETSTLTPGT